MWLVKATANWVASQCTITAHWVQIKWDQMRWGDMNSHSDVEIVCNRCPRYVRQVPCVGTLWRWLDHFLHIFISLFVLLLVLLGTESLKFLGLLGFGPRLDFAGAKQAVDDGAECKDSAAQVETRSPCLDCLLQQEHTYTLADWWLNAKVPDWIEQGLTSHQTHYRSYWGRVFMGQMTQPTVSKHWRKIGPKD